MCAGAAGGGAPQLQYIKSDRAVVCRYTEEPLSGCIGADRFWSQDRGSFAKTNWGRTGRQKEAVQGAAISGKKGNHIHI